MIYFVAGLHTHARLAAERLRIHPTGWKRLTRAEHLAGIDKALVIFLSDTLDHPMTPADRENFHDIARVVEEKRVRSRAIQVVHLELDGIA